MEKFEKKKGSGKAKKKKTTVAQAPVASSKKSGKKGSKKTKANDGGAKESDAKNDSKDDKGYELGECNGEGSGDDQSAESDEDYSDDCADEGEEGYRPGGYHPVNVGERYNARYTVLKKLGWGHFSTVWMVHDKKHTTKGTDAAVVGDCPEFVALKIQKSAPHYQEAALDEIELLRCASEAARSNEVVTEFGPKYDPHVVLLLDHFEHTGPNGQHFCFIFETLGENLLEVIKKYDYKGMPLPIVKRFVKQTCIALDFLHRHCKIIHTDLKPENILIATPPPIPSAEEVTNILAFQNPSTGVNKKRKKKLGSGGENQPTSSGELSRRIDDLSRQLQDTNLNSEGRKKIKNKMKKLKAKLKGKKKKKKKRPSRRNGEGRDIQREDDERRAMEADSYNIGGDDAALDSRADDKVPSSSMSAGQDAKGGRDTKVDAKESKHGEEHKNVPVATEERFPDPPVEVPPERELLSGEQLMMVMPPWLRPTFFSSLNFSGIPEDESESPPATRSQHLMYDSVRVIAPDDYEQPREEAFARLTMIVSIKKIIEVFGPPSSGSGGGAGAQDFAEDNDMSFANWYLSLSDQSEEKDSDEDTSLHFCLRGHGEDSKNLTGLVATCILNSIAYQPDKYSLRAPSGEDALIMWNIIHDAKRTEHIIAFLEEALSGVRFLAHYQVPTAITEDDDADLLEVMRRLVIHPLCEETDDDIPPGSDFGEGGGALIGVDIDSMSRAVTHIDDDPTLPDSERRIYSVTKYVHPLQRRIGYFAGDPDYLDETVLLFNRVHATLMALGEGSEVSGGEEKDAEEDMSHAKLEDLNNVYSNCKVKVVDLGNACWTFKHFTDDIQTRQYRSPEVLLGADYDTSADMWSLGCIVFELLTGDLLFDPRSGSKWDREEDHLAMMTELLGDFPPSVYNEGKRCHQYFTKRGGLHNISELKYWSLDEVLKDKYRFSEKDAKEIAGFIVPALNIDPKERATAKQCLENPWLADV